jgi:hypothetical protein
LKEIFIFPYLVIKDTDPCHTGTGNEKTRRRPLSLYYIVICEYAFIEWVSNYKTALAGAKRALITIIKMRYVHSKALSTL